MNSIVLLTAISVIAYSVMAVLYKASAEYVRSERMIWVATLVATILGFLVWITSSEQASTEGVILGGIAGVTFYFASVARAKAVRTSPVSLVFAITNLDLILTGALTMWVVFFDNTPTIWKILACVVAAVAVLIGSRVRGTESLSLLTYVCLGLLIISSIAALTYSRLVGEGRVAGGLLFFLFIDHVIGLIPNATYAKGLKRPEWLWGVGVGISMFIGFWTLLIVQSKVEGEQLTLVLLGLSLKTPLTAVISIPLFKEQLTFRKVFALVLASLALLLPNLGPYLFPGINPDVLTYFR